MKKYGYGFYIETHEHAVTDRVMDRIMKINPDRVKYYDTYEDALDAFNRVVNPRADAIRNMIEVVLKTPFGWVYKLPERPEENRWYCIGEYRKGEIEYYQYVKIRKVTRKLV